MYLRLCTHEGDSMKFLDLGFSLVQFCALWSFASVNKWMKDLSDCTPSLSSITLPFKYVNKS